MKGHFSLKFQNGRHQNGIFKIGASFKMVDFDRFVGL